MAANVVVEDERLQVSPGGEARMRVRITNLSNVVDTYRVTILGETLPFATPEPAEVPLFPGADGRATIVFRPPTGTRLAGLVPVGIMVASSLDAADTVVEEATIDIAGAAELASTLRPRRVEARRKSKHHITVENTGNVPTTVTLSAADADELLRFKLRPAMLQLYPGQVGQSKLKVKAFSGSAGAMRQFTVTVSEEGATPQTLDGALFQRGGRPTWLVPAIMAMVVLCVLGVVLYTKGNTKAKTETTLLAAADTTTTGAATTTTAAAAAGPTTTAAAGAAGAGAGAGAAAAGAAGAAAAAGGAAGAATTKPGGPVAPAVPTTAKVILLRPCTLDSSVPTDIGGTTRYLQCSWELNDRVSAAKVASASAVTSMFAIGAYSPPITQQPNCGTSTSTCTNPYKGKTITYGFESGKVTAVSFA